MTFLTCRGTPGLGGDPESACFWIRLREPMLRQSELIFAIPGLRYPGRVELGALFISGIEVIASTGAGLEPSPKPRQRSQSAPHDRRASPLALNFPPLNLQCVVHVPLTF